MSTRKCSQCGQVTHGTVPFCGSCGALFPMGDETALMRETIRSSLELKWVLFASLAAVLVQSLLLGGTWAVWGDKVLVPEKGRSLLQVSVEAISRHCGTDEGGTKVVIQLKPDAKKINTAQTVMAVTFGGVKAERYHIQHLGLVQRECTRDCNNQVLAQKQYAECMVGCDKTKLEEEGKEVEKCYKPCTELKDKDLPKDKKDKEWAELKCDECERRAQSYVRTKGRCEEECPSRLKVVESERGRCVACQKALPLYEGRAKACEAATTACWSFKEEQGRREVPKKINYGQAKTPKERKAAEAAYEQEKKAAIAENKSREDLENRHLRAFVNVYAPRLPGKRGMVPVKVVFRSGEEVTKEHSFIYVAPGTQDPPRLEKPKARDPYDPVYSLGFWILLLGSSLAYLGVGYLLGVSAPGGGSKQPLAAGIIGWMIFIVLVIMLGASGNALLFSVFVGLVGFVGGMIAGGRLADRFAPVA
jgi:hypothetical protein